MSIVRENLLSRPGYSPYCGTIRCSKGMPRTKFNGHQFICSCGWQSSFPDAFIQEYKRTLRIAALQTSNCDSTICQEC